MPLRLAGSHLVRAVLLAALACVLGACAGLGSEIHLEPFYSQHDMAGGGREREALAGFYLAQDEPVGARTSVRALRPLWSRRVDPDGARVTNVLFPLGLDRRTEDSTTTMFLPLFYFQARPVAGGGSRWDLVSLPGILWTRGEEGKQRLAWFPFGGAVNRLFTFDRIVFVLFPLYLRTEMAGTTSYHVLFPIFGWSKGPKSSSWRVWPLAAHAQKKGSYDRWFWLWPILHWHRARDPGTEQLSATKFLFFPLYGRTRVGTYRSHTVLWPFFGWATDPRANFWAWDGPWPFVRIQRGGKAPLAEARTRVWPFFSHFRGDRLEAHSVLWPIFHARHEDYAHAERRSFYAVPFWQSWKRIDKRGGPPSSWAKLWPLFQAQNLAGTRRSALPALSPFQRSPHIDFHYAWLWELYTANTRDEDEQGRFFVRERLLYGLWRHERDEHGSRSSLSALWATRRYGKGAERVREHSLFAGLVRWRVSESAGIELMWPAFPGPGWEPSGRPGRLNAAWGTVQESEDDPFTEAASAPSSTPSESTSAPHEDSAP